MTLVAKSIAEEETGTETKHDIWDVHAQTVSTERIGDRWDIKYLHETQLNELIEPSLGDETG